MPWVVASEARTVNVIRFVSGANRLCASTRTAGSLDLNDAPARAQPNKAMPVLITQAYQLCQGSERITYSAAYRQYITS